MAKQSGQTPNWQPISKLQLLAQMLDEALVDAEEHLQNLQSAQNNSYLLDDYTIGQINQVFSEQKVFHGVYQEQFVRWKALKLNGTQEKEIAVLERKLERLHIVVDSVLSLAAQLKEGTIENVLTKADTEIALDLLSGKLKF